MPKGTVKREPYSRIKLALIPEEHLLDGKLDLTQWPDCNVWDIRIFAARAGYKDWRYFRDVKLTDPTSPFHAHQIYGFTAKGARVVVGYFTHQHSAEWGGKEHRSKTLGNQTGWQQVTNVSGGSSAQESLEALALDT